MRCTCGSGRRVTQCLGTRSAPHPKATPPVAPRPPAPPPAPTHVRVSRRLPAAPVGPDGYHRYAVRKRSGGTRTISVPGPELREAQRWILRKVLAALPVHDACHGFRIGRSIRTNALVHASSLVVLELDLKDFFPTVTFARVAGLFRRAGHSAAAAERLALVCTEEVNGIRRLPQGAPTSPAITNALCLGLDRRLAGLAKARGWRYSRYADDLTFSLPEGSNVQGLLHQVSTRGGGAPPPQTDLPGALSVPPPDPLGGGMVHGTPCAGSEPADPRIPSLIAMIRRIVRSEGFCVHERKTRILYRNHRQIVAGLVVNGAQPPRIPRAWRRRLRAVVHRIALGGTSREPRTTIDGWVAYVTMTNPALGALLRARLTKEDA